jgi:hypothetical protein
MRPWRRRKETLGVFSLYAKRYKSVYISVNNNTNLNLFKILSNYIIWNRLSQKTISRYCPFKGSDQRENRGVWSNINTRYLVWRCGDGQLIIVGAANVM